MSKLIITRPKYYYQLLRVRPSLSFTQSTEKFQIVDCQFSEDFRPPYNIVKRLVVGPSSFFPNNDLIGINVSYYGWIC